MPIGYKKAHLPTVPVAQPLPKPMDLSELHNLNPQICRKKVVQLQPSTPLFINLAKLPQTYFLPCLAVYLNPGIRLKLKIGLFSNN